ncbi:unnamed protein product [Fusarium graminearum]|nr:unnamed protein product [Fusarium graminearum]
MKEPGHLDYKGEPILGSLGCMCWTRLTDEDSQDDQNPYPKATESTTEERSYHGDLENLPASRPHFTSISEHVRNQTRTKITSQVDGISSFPTKAGTDTEDQEEQTQWHQWTSADVGAVRHGKDDELQNRAGDEFGEEHASACHKLSRIGTEHSGGRVLANHGPPS